MFLSVIILGTNYLILTSNPITAAKASLNIVPYCEITTSIYMALGSLKVIVAASKLTNSVFFIHKLKAVSVTLCSNMKARHSKFHYMYPFLPPYFYTKIQYSKLNFNTYSILAYKMYLINTYFKYLYILLYRILYRYKKIN